MKNKELYVNVANKLLVTLKEIGIEGYIWHVATTGSVYIRFKDNRMCSVRIGDHNGREHLKYKYNLRNDLPGNHKVWVKDENIWRCYLRLTDWKNLVPILKDRFDQIQTWPPSKYEYKIPKFKTENK